MDDISVSLASSRFLAEVWQRLATDNVWILGGWWFTSVESVAWMGLGARLDTLLYLVNIASMLDSLMFPGYHCVIETSISVARVDRGCCRYQDMDSR